MRPLKKRAALMHPLKKESIFDASLKKRNGVFV